MQAAVLKIWELRNCSLSLMPYMQKNAGVDSSLINRFLADSASVANNLDSLRMDLDSLINLDLETRIEADSIRLQDLIAKLVQDSTVLRDSFNGNAH